MQNSNATESSGGHRDRGAVLLADDKRETIRQLLRNLTRPSFRDNFEQCPDPFGRLIPVYDRVCFSVQYRHQIYPQRDLRILNQDYATAVEELSHRPQELTNIAIAITDKCNSLYEKGQMQKSGVFILAATFRVPKEETQFLSVSCCLRPFCLRPPQNRETALLMPEFYSQQTELQQSRVSIVNGWHLTFAFDYRPDIPWPELHYLSFSELSILSYFVCNSRELEFTDGRKITQMIKLVSVDSEAEHYESLHCMATENKTQPFFELANMLRDEKAEPGGEDGSLNCVGMDIAGSCLVGADLLGMEILRGQRILNLINNSRTLYEDEFNSIKMTYYGISPIVLYYCNYTAIGPFCDSVFYSMDFVEEANFPGREDFAECGQPAPGLLVMCRIIVKNNNGKLKIDLTALNAADLRILLEERQSRHFSSAFELCEFMIVEDQYDVATKIGFDCLCLPQFLKNTTIGCNNNEEYKDLIDAIYDTTLKVVPDRPEDIYAHEHKICFANESMSNMIPMELRTLPPLCYRTRLRLNATVVRVDRGMFSQLAFEYLGVFVFHRFFPKVEDFASTFALVVCEDAVKRRVSLCHCAHSRCPLGETLADCSVCCCPPDQFVQLFEEDQPRLEMIARKKFE